MKPKTFTELEMQDLFLAAETYVLTYEGPRIAASVRRMSPEAVRVICVRMILDGHWLDAVKYVRNAGWGFGLKESKEYIDRLRSELGGA